MSTTDTRDSSGTGVGYLAWANVIQRLDLHRSTKQVAQALGLHTTGKTGRDARPGREVLAQETGLSKRSITTHLGILERLGLIVCVQRGSNMGRAAKASEYRLEVPQWIAERVKATRKGQMVDTSNPPDQVQVAAPDNGKNKCKELHLFSQEQVQNGAQNKCSPLPPTSTRPPQKGDSPPDVIIPDAVGEMNSPSVRTSSPAVNPWVGTSPADRDEPLEPEAEEQLPPDSGRGPQ